MKIKSKTAKLFLEILIIIFILIVVAASVLADLSFIKIPDVFILRIKNVEDLLFSLFTTQATVATISIAIIALASGVVSENILGISITRYISQLRPRVFKHQRLIIFSLIITFINYFVVSYNLFNTAIAIFLLSIIVSIILVKDMFIIFLGRKEIEHQIEIYIIENYNIVGVENFRVSLLESENASNVTHLKENLEVIQKIFEKEINLQSDNNKSQLLMEIESIVSDTFLKLYKKQKSEALLIILDYICTLYELANSKDNPVALTIWDDLSKEFFYSIKLFSEEQIYNSIWFYKLHSELYKNQKIQTKEGRNNYINCYDLKYYSVWIYYTLIVNNTSFPNQYDRKKLLKILYSDLYGLLFHSNLKRKTPDILSEYCAFTKALIDEGELEILNEELFSSYRYIGTTNEYQIVFIIACIYLYYIVCREELLVGTESQKKAKEILEINHDIIENFLSRIDLIDFVANNLDLVNKQMQMWEVMPKEGAKCMIMDTVIKDFFVFVALYKYGDKEQIAKMVTSLFGNQTFSIYTHYFSGNKNQFMSLFEQYISVLFGPNISIRYQEKSELLKDALNEKYKKEEIVSGKLNAVTDSTKNNFEQKIKNIFQNKIEENSYLFENELLDNVKYTHFKICLGELDLPSSFINDSKIDDYIDGFIHSGIINAYIYALGSTLSIVRMNYDDKTKQETLLKLISDLEINTDTFIGNHDVFWGEENKYLLKKYIEDKKQIRFPEGYNNFYIIDHKLVHCNLSDFSVEFSDLSKKDIEEMCKTDETGKLMYNVTNDIYIPFDQNELEEHIHRIRKKIRLYAQIHYRIESDKVGAGVQIIFD